MDLRVGNPGQNQNDVLKTHILLMFIAEHDEKNVLHAVENENKLGAAVIYVVVTSNCLIRVHLILQRSSVLKVPSADNLTDKNPTNRWTASQISTELDRLNVSVDVSVESCQPTAPIERMIRQHNH